MFSEEAAQRFPEPKHWDHAIDLLDGAPVGGRRTSQSLGTKQTEKAEE